jgi:hypothetical protein
MTANEHRMASVFRCVIRADHPAARRVRGGASVSNRRSCPAMASVAVMWVGGAAEIAPNDATRSQKWRLERTTCG